MFPVEFKFAVACPEGDRCTLLHCPFEHVAGSRKRGGDELVSKPKQTKLNREMASKLVPRPVHPNAPESVQQRLNFLKQLENYYKTKDPNTCIDRAVNKEYEVAASCNSKISYTAKIKTLLYNLIKYGNENGKVVQAKMTSGNTDDWLAQLYEICVPRNKLKRHGFCLEIPRDEPKEPKEGAESFLPAKPVRDPNLKTCLRCHTDFRRDSQMEETQCRYHPGKPEVIKQTENSAASNDYNTRVYSCCNQPMGEAQGCATLKHHVFKLMDYKEMHEEIPFVELPEHVEGSKALKAVGMDCEMGFTSCGFECIKISIVDYVSEEIVLDKLVKPKGQVIDLNTHVSDVAEIPDDALTLPQIQSLLQEIFDSETVVIGHGLENDFNCLRLIPPHVVDTAILYSESSLVRKKDSLKKLAWKYLSMNIQSGTHDSVEDCVIPIKIVKNRVAKLAN